MSCNGGNNGAINISASGGAGSFTYLWSNTSTAEDQTNLTANTYTVTVTDGNSCTAQQSFIVTQPSPIVINGIITDVNCNSGITGAINITVSGGTSPYTYLWSNTSTAEDQTNLAANTYTVTVTDFNSCTAQQVFVVNQSLPVTITGVVTDVLCNGGSTGAINITATGGTGGYTYLWSNSSTAEDQTNLAANTYTVTATDNSGCTGQQSFTVNQPTSITVNGVITNVSCNGGSNGAINITASGGTGGYTYLWSNTSTAEDQTNLTANTYTVTVTDANGCTAQQSFIVNEPLPITATFNNVDESCGQNNGSSTVNPSGGNGGYTYLWSTGSTFATISNLAPGTYTVTVTDVLSCSNIFSTTINAISGLNIVSSITPVNCNGGSDGEIDLTVSGGTQPYTFLWSNLELTEDISGLTSDFYTVTITDLNLCVEVDTFFVPEPTPITATFNIINAACNNPNGSATVTASGGSPGYTYLWSNGFTTAGISNVVSGPYTVTVTDFHICTSSFIANIGNDPGPSIVVDSIINVSCNGGNNGAIYTTATSGTIPLQYLWSNNFTADDITGLPANNYTVTVTDVRGCTATAVANVIEPSALSLSFSSTTANCNLNNGSAQVTPSGGVSPYQILWSNGDTTSIIQNLFAGTYTATITDDNGCVITDIVIVPNSGVPQINLINKKDVTCNGGNNGSITITASNGVGPYTYLWSNGDVGNVADTLTASTFTVTVTDNTGCTQTASYTINEPSAITLQFSFTPEPCNNGNGSATVTANGGTPGYTYLWSNNNTTAAAIDEIISSPTINNTTVSRSRKGHTNSDCACASVSIELDLWR